MKVESVEVLIRRKRYLFPYTNVSVLYLTLADINVSYFGEDLLEFWRRLQGVSVLLVAHKRS